MNKKLLITGGAGFIGSAVIRHIIDNTNHSVVNVDKLTPGITGWAQINGRDDISIEQKVQFDTEYLVRQSILFDFEILFKTFMQGALRRNISH